MISLSSDVGFPHHTHSILQKSSDISHSTEFFIMGNNIYQDESWGVKLEDIEGTVFERDLEEWTTPGEPLNEVHWVDEPMEPGIKGKPWSHELFLKYV